MLWHLMVSTSVSTSSAPLPSTAFEAVGLPPSKRCYHLQRAAWTEHPAPISRPASDFHFQVSPVFPLSLAGGGPILSAVGCAAVAVSPVCSKVEFATHSLIKAGLAKQIFLLGLL